MRHREQQAEENTV